MQPGCAWYAGFVKQDVGDHFRARQVLKRWDEPASLDFLTLSPPIAPLLARPASGQSRPKLFRLRKKALDSGLSGSWVVS